MDSKLIKKVTMEKFKEKAIFLIVINITKIKSAKLFKPLLIIVFTINSKFLYAIQATNLEQSVLKVGTLNEPHVFSNTTRGIGGFDYELINSFATYINRPFKMVPFHSINALYDALNNRQIDIIAAGLVETNFRKKTFNLSPPLYQVDQIVIYKRGSKQPKTLASLNGKITVPADSTYVEILNEFKQQTPDFIWHESKIIDSSTEELLDMVASNQIEYTITNSIHLQIHRRFKPRLKQGLILKENQNVVWLLNKDTQHSLMSKVLHFWSEIKSTDKLSQLYERYFGHVQRFDYVDTRAFIRAVNSRLPKYQHLFKKYANELDWRKLAAASYQESHWKPRARSKTGVRGMMMLTLPTAKQMGIKNRLDPEQSIKGGAKYLHSMLKRLPETIPDSQRIWFALAAYNLGLGHVRDAINIAKQKGLNSNSWKDLKKVLPLLQEYEHYSKTHYGYARGKEAVHYVDNIRRYYDTLVWLDKQKTATASNNEYFNVQTGQF